ncbi:MAG TPA: hypothetical protein VJ840_16360 [Gemmatimonadaceae bacterium]|nr:hypothetical protein [Gemmatimonadaceae bacterium]
MNKAILLAGAALLSACASSSQGTSTPRPTSQQSSSDFITSVEVAATPVSNAYDLISRLRPNWLRVETGSIRSGTRSQIIVVYLDDTRLGDVTTLRTISTSGIQSLRYYDATRAATVLRNPGSDPIAGAIVISTTNVQ